MAIINSILENSVCCECKTGQLKIREDVQFTSCGLNKNYFTCLTSENVQYEVNLRSVYALRCIGKGHYGHASTSSKFSMLQ
jgi:hypothetical protein